MSLAASVALLALLAVRRLKPACRCCFAGSSAWGDRAKSSYCIAAASQAGLARQCACSPVATAWIRRISLAAARPLPQQPAVSAAPLVGSPAPEFKATAVHNDQFVDVSLSQYKGKYVVSCWLQWCLWRCMQRPLVHRADPVTALRAPSSSSP